MDVCFTIRGRLLLHDDLFGNDVDRQRVCRRHVIAARFSNYPHARVSREVFIQCRVNHSSDLSTKNKQVFIICTSLITQSEDCDLYTCIYIYI